MQCTDILPVFCAVKCIVAVVCSEDRAALSRCDEELQIGSGLGRQNRRICFDLRIVLEDDPDDAGISRRNGQG